MNPATVRGVILAAGRGARMGRLTDHRPKCRIRLGGASLLDWQLAALGQAGVGPIAAVRGYRGEDLAVDGLTNFENPDWSSTGIFWSLWQARSWMRSFPCLVSYADIVYHPHHVSRLLERDAEIAIAYDECWRELWERRFADPALDAESFRAESGELVEIGGPVTSLEDIHGQYLGLLKFTPDGWAQLERFLRDCDESWVRRTDMTGLLRRLIGRVDVAAVPVRGRWCEVDNAADLRLYEGNIASGGTWTHDWRF